MMKTMILSLLPVMLVVVLSAFTPLRDPALEARARLGLALAGRLSEGDVNRAWKRAASEHHPDRGGLHDTMQAINAARDLLLGRGIET